ncbi:hypothetical protein XELAEV_18003665mg, partial [Xenopus laevis]
TLDCMRQMLGVTAHPTEILIYCIMCCVRPFTSEVEPFSEACRLQITKAHKEVKYIKEGDIMIGGLVTAHLNALLVPFRSDGYQDIFCINPYQQGFRHIVDFLFAVDQTNKNPMLLPNVTLGYYIYDSCGDAMKAMRNVFHILFGTGEPVPNYSCGDKSKIAGFIGDLTSETTVPIAQILTLYGYSQISYGATNPALSDRVTFPYFFRTVQSDDTNYFALSKLLRHFGWTWVGIITFDDMSGEEEYERFLRYLSSEGICTEFRIQMRSNEIEFESNRVLCYNTIQASSTGVIIFIGSRTVPETFVYALGQLNAELQDKTLILPSHWGNNDIVIRYAPNIFNESLVFMQAYNYDVQTNEMSRFLGNLHPSKHQENSVLENIFAIFHLCFSKDKEMNDLCQYEYFLELHNCSGKEHIRDLYFFRSKYSSPRVLLAIDMMSHALHEMKKSESLPFKHQVIIKSYSAVLCFISSVIDSNRSL